MANGKLVSCSHSQRDKMGGEQDGGSDEGLWLRRSVLSTGEHVMRTLMESFTGSRYLRSGWL